MAAFSRTASLLCKNAVRSESLGKLNNFCTSARGSKSYQLVVVGSGAGGAAIAARFSSKLGKGKVAIIEPSDAHYNQAMWTLVGGGIVKLEDTYRPMASIIPSTCDWIKDRATTFKPDTCTVSTQGGEEIKYEYLVVAVGLQLRYEDIKGLTEGLEMDPMLVSNYSAKYVTRTINAIDKFKGGQAVFTLPNTPIKCPGAPQKIMYLAESKWKKNGVKKSSTITYNTAMGVMLGAPKYAEVLRGVCEKRGIQVNFKTNLVEVNPEKKEAVFMKLETGETYVQPYDFMHVTPPMSTPTELKSSPLVNAGGFLTVDKYTLQHSQYPNVFGIGDCTDVPTPKTAAAVASQCGIVAENLAAVMKGGTLTRKYDGYTACPLVTSYNTCIMAEFAFEGVPMETFPIDQGKERQSMYWVKLHILPRVYNLMTKGWWSGPAPVRKIFHLGLSKQE
ncbi:sulfide:quinone oxidoreductase, mitochondrial [Lingula anatina]|uniref:Sulfide:quinone oxidoreductase, mitochondrial n=1 Tax=Lingula anatina TaxID=7574 RepID=A0A1S3JMN8_LINAN|nr:sulfide:quinone oxidoreductase, mitochondrial [Lingula anatina]|eukprot:XP_013411642.1 sulfide:quinone oxidoreductase, mitochondrial [Lingula anatina]